MTIRFAPALVVALVTSGPLFSEASWPATRPQPPRPPCTEPVAEGPDCFTVEGALRLFPTAVRRYRITTPTVDQSYAAGLALSAFGFSGSLSEDAFAVTVAGGQKSLLVYKDSGEFSFQDDSKLWNADYPGPNLNAAGAIAAANAFLGAHGLMPSQAHVEDAKQVTVKRDDGTIAINHWFVSYRMSIDAAAGLGPALSVEVAGASIDVLVGDGEIVGLNWNWRPLSADFGPGGVLPAFSQPTALAIAQRVQAFSPLCVASTTRMIYSIRQHTGVQAYAFPSYVFLAEGLEDGIVIPATSSSPYAIIETPPNNSSFTPCAPLTLAATVIGGTPPYSYSWTDPSQYGVMLGNGSPAPTDLLGTSNPLTVSLDGGMHPINFVVTDANGASWTQSTTIEGPHLVCAPRPRRVCTDPPIPVVFEDVKHVGWTFHAQITTDDGLRLDRVAFLGHRLASDMELPFYWFQNALMDYQACELKFPTAGNLAGNCVSHLEDPGIRVVKNKDNVEVHACYCVDHLPTGDLSGSMTVCQVFIFWEGTKGCDPVDSKGDCVPYKPLVQYWYFPPLIGDNPFVQVRWDQRFDYDPPDTPNRAAFFQDPDGGFGPNVAKMGGISIHHPAPRNEEFHLVALRGNPGEMDNYHQKTESSLVRIPGCVDAGVWNCAHIHWRWGTFLHFHGGGKVLPPASQTVFAYSLRYNPTEIDPFDFDLERFRRPAPEPIGDVDLDLVFWNETFDIDPSDEKVGWNDWFFH